MARKIDLTGWEKIGEDETPKWVKKEINKLKYRGQLRAALYKNKVIILKGRRFEYKLEPWGEGSHGLDVCLDVYRKKRHYKVKKSYRKSKTSYRVKKYRNKLTLAVFLISFVLILGAMLEWDIGVFTNSSFTNYESSEQSNWIEQTPTPSQTILQTPISTPAPTPTLTPTPKPEINIPELEKQIHELINEERKNQGLPTLAWNGELNVIARKHSQDMANRNYFSHEDPEGHDFSYRYQQEGFNCEVRVGNYIYMGAENIFQNNLYSSVTYYGGIPSYDWNTQEEIAESTVQGWMNSLGHRQNILTVYWKREGVGVAISSDDKVYITEDFC